MAHNVVEKRGVMKCFRTETYRTRGQHRAHETKRRNNGRQRATHRRSMANFPSNLAYVEEDSAHIPAKNAARANWGCIGCGYVQRG